jgi:hypothetical protein
MILDRFFTYDTQISTENIYRILIKQTGHVLQCLEQDLCRKCAKNIEKNPPKHE